MNPKIIVVTGMHGDERHALAVGQRIARHHPQVQHVLAHQAAVDARKRYLETDLNRSFGATTALSLEEQLAIKLQEDLLKQAPDILIDFHNTTASGTTCGIVTTPPTQAHKALLSTLGFERIVVMPPSGSLLSVFNGTKTVAVSIEIANDATARFKPKDLSQTIAEYRADSSSSNSTPSIYRFAGTVKKSTLKRVGITLAEIENFKALSKKQKLLLSLDSNLEYYPIFSGGKHMGLDAFNLVIPE